MTVYNVCIDVEVQDEGLLFYTALDHAVTNDGMDRDDAIELLKPDGEIDVAACLQMVLDPGVSPAGTSIVESYCN